MCNLTDWRQWCNQYFLSVWRFSWWWQHHLHVYTAAIHDCGVKYCNLPKWRHLFAERNCGLHANSWVCFSCFHLQPRSFYPWNRELLNSVTNGFTEFMQNKLATNLRKSKAMYACKGSVHHYWNKTACDSLLINYCCAATSVTSLCWQKSI